MYSLILLAVISFLLTFFVTPLVRDLAVRWGCLDAPDARKIHRTPIPRLGGVAVALSFATSLGLVYLLKVKGGLVLWHGWPDVVRLLPAASIIFATGLADDLVGLKPWQKIVGEVAAGALAFFFGVHATVFAYHHVAPWLSFPLTMFWLVLCTNALNLIDGMDGLAAGVGLFATSTMLVAALVQHNVVLALVTVPLAGALLGFLRYNFNPATIFLGDCGSLLVGFLLGCYGVLWSQKSATILGMTAPLVALSVPLLDTALAIARRFLRHQPIFSPDRGHIHHRLLDHGFTPRKAALVLYGCCGLGAVGSLLMMNENFAGLVVITFCVVAWIGVQHLGYIEFGVAGRMFVDGAFRRQIGNQVALRAFERSLQDAVTPHDCWIAVEAAAVEFGFCDIEMSFCGCDFKHENGTPLDDTWAVQIPLPTGDYIRLSREFEVAGPVVSIIPFADTLRRILVAKSETGEYRELELASAQSRGGVRTLGGAGVAASDSLVCEGKELSHTGVQAGLLNLLQRHEEAKVDERG